MRTLSKIFIRTLCLLCGLCGSLMAQQPDFKYRAALPKVSSAGYYRINLQPALTAKAKIDLSDIRISDAANNIVSYVKTGDLPAHDRSIFTQFAEVKTNDKTDTCTVYVVRNSTGVAVHELWLKLKNTDVSRRITIAGSDDLHKWFAISENMDMGTATETDNTGMYMQHITFPASSYGYLKLVINNGRKSPVNILEAGVYAYLPVKPGFVPLPPLKFHAVESPGHITHLYVDFDQAYLINKLKITLTDNTLFFNREVNVYVNNPGHRWLTSTRLDTNDPDINLSVKALSLDVHILNKDNAPLPIQKVEAFQSQNYVIARLEPGKDYFLVFGNEAATAPEYDLQFFAAKITRDPPEIEPLSITANPAYKATSNTSKTHPYLLWISICVAVIVLSVLTINMTRDVNKKAG